MNDELFDRHYCSRITMGAAPEHQSLRGLHRMALGGSERYLAGPAGDRSYQAFTLLSSDEQHTALKALHDEWNLATYYALYLKPKLDAWVATGAYPNDDNEEFPKIGGTT
jgi:hypothetical protein